MNPLVARRRLRSTRTFANRVGQTTGNIPRLMRAARSMAREEAARLTYEQLAEIIASQKKYAAVVHYDFNRATLAIFQSVERAHRREWRRRHTT